VRWLPGLGWSKAAPRRPTPKSVLPIDYFSIGDTFVKE
jgi:hypothetical protein